MTAALLALLLWNQSFFNGRALGENVYAADAWSRSLGAPAAFSVRNPAASAFNDRTVLELSVFGEGLLGNDSARQRLLGDLVPGDLAASFPLGAGFTLGANWTERFSQDLDVYGDSAQVGDLVYQRHVRGRGGVYDIGLALGWRWRTLVAVGAQFDGLLGGSVEEWNLLVNGDYLTRDTAQCTYSGYSYRLGLEARPSIFTIAAFVEGPAALGVTTAVASAGKTETGSAQITLPLGFGVGVAARLGERSRLFLDCRRSAYAEALVADTLRSDFGNGTALSLGFEFPVARLALRAGVRYEESYIRGRNGRGVTGLGLAGGIGIPVKGFGTIDLALEGIRRGDGALTESLLRAGVTLSFEELWQRRTRKWGW